MARRKPTPTIDELGNERTCEGCGRAFAPVSGSQGRFCQRSCWYAWRSAQPSQARARHIREMVSGAAVPPGQPGRYPDRAGYVRLRWRVGACEYVECREHRFIHGLPVGQHVHHLNGIKHDNRPENLEQMPPGDHARLHHPSRFDQAEIARLYRSGLTMQQIAEQFGTHSGRISRVLKAAGVQARPYQQKTS